MWDLLNGWKADVRKHEAGKYVQKNKNLQWGIRRQTRKNSKAGGTPGTFAEM